MFSGCKISSDNSSSAGVQASNSSSDADSCGIRCPDWLEMVTPTPPSLIIFPTSSKSTAVPYKSTFNIVSIDACEGDTPAALISMVTSPYVCPVLIKFSIDVLSDKSIWTGTTSNPASFIILAADSAFSDFLSPTTIFFPVPIRLAIAIPIWPAPAHKITSFLILNAPPITH